MDFYGLSLRPSVVKGIMQAYIENLKFRTNFDNHDVLQTFKASDWSVTNSI